MVQLSLSPTTVVHSHSPEPGSPTSEIKEAPQTPSMGGHDVDVVPSEPRPDYVLVARTKLGGYVMVDSDSGVVTPVQVQQELDSGRTWLSFLNPQKWKLFSGEASALHSIEEISTCSHSEEYINLTTTPLDGPEALISVPKKGSWQISEGSNNLSDPKLQVANKKLAEPYKEASCHQTFEADIERGFYHTCYLPSKEGITEHVMKTEDVKEKIQEAKKVISMFSNQVFSGSGNTEKATVLKNDLLAMCQQTIPACLTRVYFPENWDSCGLATPPSDTCLIQGGKTEFTYSYDVDSNDIKILVQTKRIDAADNFKANINNQLKDVSLEGHKASGTTSMELVVKPDLETGRISKEVNEDGNRISNLKITSLSGTWEIDPPKSAVATTV